jgi:hypothetical protein
MGTDQSGTPTPLIINGEERVTKETFPVYDPSDTTTVVGLTSAASAGEANS